MSGPLTGRRIAVTRPETGALGDRLLELGATVVHVPLIEIADPADGGTSLRSGLSRIDQFDWLVVTSANGARRAGPAAAGHPAVRLAAVGPATAAALETATGRSVDLVPAVAQAEGLLTEFTSVPSRVLLAQADRARPLLANGLSAAGHNVTAVAAYRTVVRELTPDERDRLRDVDAVVLASGTAAEGYVRAGGPSSSALVVAIGPITAAAATGLGLTVAGVADVPGPAALSSVLVRVLR